MKKWFLILAVLTIATSVSARGFHKKDWYLSGALSGLSFGHVWDDSDSATTFEVMATGGYFLSNKFAIDGTLSYARIDEVEAVAFGAGLRFYPVADLYARAIYSAAIADSEVMPYLGAEIGYDIFASERVYFEPAIFYKKGLGSLDETNTLGLSIGVGVKF